MNWVCLRQKNRQEERLLFACILRQDDQLIEAGAKQITCKPNYKSEHVTRTQMQCGLPACTQQMHSSQQPLSQQGTKCTRECTFVRAPTSLTRTWSCLTSFCVKLMSSSSLPQQHCSCAIQQDFTKQHTKLIINIEVSYHKLILNYVLTMLQECIV